MTVAVLCESKAFQGEGSIFLNLFVHHQSVTWGSVAVRGEGIIRM